MGAYGDYGNHRGSMVDSWFSTPQYILLGTRWNAIGMHGRRLKPYIYGAIWWTKSLQKLDKPWFYGIIVVYLIERSKNDGI